MAFFVCTCHSGKVGDQRQLPYKIRTSVQYAVGTKSLACPGGTLVIPVFSVSLLCSSFRDLLGAHTSVTSGGGPLFVQAVWLAYT